MLLEIKLWKVKLVDIFFIDKSTRHYHLHCTLWDLCSEIRNAYKCVCGRDFARTPLASIRRWLRSFG